MNRYEIAEIPLDDNDRLIDNVTGEELFLPNTVSMQVCRMLNDESERADRLAEANTTEALLKLQWERNVNMRFAEETIRILNKYGIESLAKLDQVLMNERVW